MDRHSHRAAKLAEATEEETVKGIFTELWMSLWLRAGILAQMTVVRGL